MKDTNTVNPFLEADRLYNSPLAQEMLREYGEPHPSSLRDDTFPSQGKACDDNEPLLAEGLCLSGRMPWDEPDEQPQPQPHPPLRGDDKPRGTSTPSVTSATCQLPQEGALNASGQNKESQLLTRSFDASLLREGDHPKDGGRSASPAGSSSEPPFPLLRTISAAEIARATYTPPPFVVEGLLPAGLTVFAAPPKTGKSWLCLELAHCVATGAPFWGRATCAGSVLYLDLESRDYRVQSRLAKTGLPGTDALRFVFEAERLDTGLIPQLNEHLCAHPDLRLVIVDTLARVKGSGRQKSDAYITDTMTLAPLQNWALAHGVAVICVTHMRKQGFVRADSDPFEQITGSNAQFGVADGAWLITGAREDRERRFIASGRDYEGVELAVSFQQEHCRWRCLGESEDQEREKYEASPVVRTIRALLTESGGAPVRVTAQDLLTAVIQRYGMVGYSPTTLSKHLKALEHDLFQYESILYTPPQSNGRNGRIHEFCFAPHSNPRNEQICVPSVTCVTPALFS